MIMNTEIDHEHGIERTLGIREAFSILEGPQTVDLQYEGKEVVRSDEQHFTHVVNVLIQRVWRPYPM